MPNQPHSSPSDVIQRAIVGAFLFCIIPAVIGLLAVGPGGLLLFFAVPALLAFLLALLAFGTLVEWVFGGSPRQHMEREREMYRGL